MSVLSAAVGLLLAAGPAGAAPGDPDPNYGGFGQTPLPLQAGDDIVLRAELGFDQKLVLVGRRLVSGDTDLLVLRLDADGTLDEGFGAGGAVLTDVANRNDSAEAVTLDPLGYVLVAGWVTTSGAPNAVVARYDGAGVLDPSFATTGLVLMDVGGADDRAYAVAARPDARVVIAGQSGNALLLAQFDDLGAPDLTFGAGGVATPDPSPGPDRAWAAALQLDGKLVVAGESSGDVLVARFLTTGAPDPSFGVGGYVVRDAGGTDVARDVQVRANGSIVVAGTTTAGAAGDGFVLGLEATGAGLAGFGMNGLVLSGLVGADEFVAVDATANGGVVAAGRVAGAMDEDLLVVRLSSSGALDAGFGIGGVVTRDFGTTDDGCVGMAVERSGRIVGGASVTSGANQDAGAFRLLGDPPAKGEEFQVNTYTTDQQGEPRVAVDGSGRFVVVWSSYGGPGVDPLDSGIRAQRYEADGEPSGPAFQVNSYTTGYQLTPAVAADAAGNFVVVWQSDGSPAADQSGSGILGRRFDASGNPLGPEFQVNEHTTGNQVYPRVAANVAGDFVVVWESDTSAYDQSLASVQGRFFAASGTPLTPADLLLNEVTTGEQRSPVVAMSGADVVVAWDTDVGSGDDLSSSVAARRFSSAGVPAGSEFQVNVYTPGVQAFPDVAMGSDGRFLVTWHGDGPGDVALTGFGSFARRYTAAGAPVGGQFAVNDQTAGEQGFTGAGFDADDSFLVVWHGSGPGDDFGVFGRRFSADGTANGSSFRLNRDTEDGQRFTAIGQGIGGAFVVAWETFAYQDSDRSGAAVAAARFDGQTSSTTTSTLPGGTTTTSTSLPGTTTTTLPGTSTSTTMIGGSSTTTSTSATSTTTSTSATSTTTSTSTSTSTSTTLPGATTTTSTTLPGATTTTSTTVPGGTTTTSTTLPGGTTTTSSTLPGGTTTTSTTTPGGSTTTTTLPGPPGVPLTGTKLIVKVKPGNPAKTLVKAIAKDGGVSLGAGNESGDDPVTADGGVRVAFEGGFDGDYRVAGDRWKYLKKVGQNRGYKAKQADPVRAVVVKPGKLLKVVAKGDAIAVDLASEPTAVEVVVRLGAHRHCMRFVGTKNFVAGRKLVSTSGVRPSACLP